MTITIRFNYPGAHVVRNSLSGALNALVTLRERVKLIANVGEDDS
jgi:hypothetical protein